jgi:hypothetical protein
MAENMPPDDNPQKALKMALEHLSSLAKGDDTKLKESVYNSFSAISYLLIEAKKANFQPGWALKVKGPNGLTLFTPEEAGTIEGLAKHAEALFQDNASQSAKEHAAAQAEAQSAKEESPKEQTGGKLSLTPITSKAGIFQKIQQKLPTGISFDTSLISIDGTYWKIRNFLKGLDQQTHDLSRAIGPFKFFYDSPVDIPVPVPIPFPLVSPPFITIVTVKIPPRVIPFLIENLVETIRLIFSVGPLSNEVARKVLSIVLAIIDLIKGEWKHGILSFAGYYGQYPLIAGLIGKVFLNVISLIAPDIQEALYFDIYRSGKSIFIGFYLWVFSVFAPDFIRGRVKSAFENPKYLDIVTKIKESADSKGYVINPVDTFIISFDDIQNLQSIARQPSVMCSAEFHKAIEALVEIIPVRLFLEMINIPCDPETFDLTCGPYANLPIEDTIGAAIGVPPDDAKAATATKPDETKPGETKPGEAKPGTPTKPVGPKPSGPKPLTAKKVKKVKKGGTRKKVKQT